MSFSKVTRDSEYSIDLKQRVISEAVKNLSEVSFVIDEQIIKSEVAVLLFEIPNRMKKYNCYRLPDNFEKTIIDQVCTMFFGRVEKTVTMPSDSRDDDYFSDISIDDEEEDDTSIEAFEEDERSW